MAFNDPGARRGLLLFLGGILFVAMAIFGTYYLLDHRSPPPSVNLADEENAVDPYHVEMDCYDQVLQDNHIGAQDAQAALARCRSMGPAAPAGAVAPAVNGADANPGNAL